MFRTITQTLALLGTLVMTASSALGYETGIQQRHEVFYQNVTADDLPELIGGNVWVAYRENGRFEIVVSLVGGSEVTCVPNGKTSSTRWESITYDYREARERYPLVKTVFPDGTFGLGAYKYVPETGGLYYYIVDGSYWWEYGTGHLQSDLPAAVYDICPDFPSAESLGLEVNAAQTSKFYKKLVKQHPGKRIMRPDLVTDVTVEKY